jgi:hypothetical protein
MAWLLRAIQDGFFALRIVIRISFSTDGHTTYVTLTYRGVIMLISFIFLSVLIFGTKTIVYSLV